MDDPLKQYADAIASVESAGSGGYSALGPWVRRPSGGYDRAYGRYQVMGDNIPQWTQDALGQSMTPGEFVQNQAAQDAVFRHRFGSYVDKYGSPQDAASVWFTGKPMTGRNANDGYTDRNTYVDKFNHALGYADDASRDPGLSAIQNAIRNGNASMADQPVLFGGNPTPVGAFGAIGRMLGIGSEPELGRRLRNAGAALLSVNNPGGAAALQSAANGENQWETLEAGTDPLTQQKSFIQINRATGQVRPLGGGQAAPGGAGGGVQMAGGAPSGGAAPSGMPSMSQVQNAINDFHAGKISKQDLLEHTGPVGAYAQNLAEGSENPTLFGMARTNAGFGLAADQIAHAIDPSYNPNMVQARQLEYKNLINRADPKTIGGMAANLGAAMQHGVEGSDLSDALGAKQWNSNYSGLNAVQNAIKRYGGDQEYKTLMNRRETALDSFSREMDKVLSGGNQSVTGMQEIRSHFRPDMSPDEVKGAIAQLAAQGREKLEPLVYNRNKAFGRLGTAQEEKPEDIMSPDSVKALQKLQAIKENGPGGSTSAPAAKTAINPKTGERLILKDGKWQPLK
jgi:hypothetical protein